MKIVALAALAIVSSLAVAMAPAQPASTGKKHRIVFEVTASEAESWQSLLNNVENVRGALGADQTEIEVVAHGGALGMLMTTNEAQSQRMKQLAADRVVFAACRNTMKRKNVAPDQLLPFVTTVDSGVAEVVRKQEAGWSYIKSDS